MRLFFLFLFSLTAILEAVEQQKSILIKTFAVEGVKPWDPDSIKSGITGSEEAVIYMAQKLADIGYRVVVLGNPPESSPHSADRANPRFTAKLLKEKDFDIAISWRNPYNAGELKKYARRVYFWPHDSSYRPVPAGAVREFDDVLWLSNWQREQWASINPPFAKFDKIFGNGINPKQFGEVKEKKNPYSCIYGSNYGQGLETLLDIWPEIKEAYPLATLDIYYGWQHWGFLSPEKEKKMKAQLAKLSYLDVRDHGMVSHEELALAFENASLWTYPLKNTETFCITALKAQLAGAMPVVIEKSALKETVKGGYRCQSEADYRALLLLAMSEAETITAAQRNQLRDSVLNEYTWERIALKWDELFNYE